MYTLKWEWVWLNHNFTCGNTICAGTYSHYVVACTFRWLLHIHIHITLEAMYTHLNERKFIISAQTYWYTPLFLYYHRWWRSILIVIVGLLSIHRIHYTSGTMHFFMFQIWNDDNGAFLIIHYRFCAVFIYISAYKYIT